jgi:hypothetical protein
METSDMDNYDATNMRKLSDDILAAYDASQMNAEEVETYCGMTEGSLHRYIENPWSLPLVMLYRLADALNRKVEVKVVPR